MQHRCDTEAYQSLLGKNHCAWFTMLSSRHNNIIGELEYYRTIQEMWNRLKIAYSGVSTTKLRVLTLKLMTYMIDPEYTMVENLRDMLA